MQAGSDAGGRRAEELRARISAFLAQARQPAVLEPGEEILLLSVDNFLLECRGSQLALQAWDRTRSISRRIVSIEAAVSGRIDLVVERFGRREGPMFLVDLARRSGTECSRRGGRMIFRERFRMFLRRQFPQWKLAELSSEPNLEFSLSPSYPRAFLRHGQHGWAAIACPPGQDAAAVVSFGLIWLDYLRRRERKLTVEGLALYTPEGREHPVSLRLLCLNPESARFLLFSYSAEGYVNGIDPTDFGNIDSRLEQCRRTAPNGEHPLWERIHSQPGVESITRHDGRISLRVKGLEFASIEDGELRFGLRQRHVARENNAGEIEALARELTALRSPDAPSRTHTLYREYPEAWLESEVRSSIQTINADLLPSPLYGQVPAFAGVERGVLDLLAVDRAGRLAVLELKASPDLHLPMQALDYWIRVKWHLDRGEFCSHGYFPGFELRPDPPRLLLVSPALDFHPTTESLLSFLAPSISVERIGVGVKWRKGLEVMFRLNGSERPR
jgi:hypothetical protein